MADFHFLENEQEQRWVISAPRRAHRPKVGKTELSTCPFCPGSEGEEEELFRINGTVILEGAKATDRISQQLPEDSIASPHTVQYVPSLQNDIKGRSDDSDWLVRVIPNKFPFAPIHELIIHSPDHHKNIDELPLEQVEQIVRVYRQRFLTHQHKGHVYLFHNRGKTAGESIPHPHTQVTVIPSHISLQIPRLIMPLPALVQETMHFTIFCPETSVWSDEVWVAPKNGGTLFGEITDPELVDFAFTLKRLITIFDLRHGSEFPFNFYIYPGVNWYMRLIPREKTLGGFEVGTGIFVNTQDPKETIAFIKEHFDHPDEERIRTEHQAAYRRRV